MNNKKLVDQVTEAMNLLKKAQDDNTKLLKIIEASVTNGNATALGGSGYRCGKGKNQKEEYKKTDHLMEPEETGASVGRNQGQHHGW
eukprot:5262874-Ditylum_brightwellii.AAC.1